jgi:UDP-N-acetylglucosamine 1-carboxyvinyltransferase
MLLASAAANRLKSTFRPGIALHYDPGEGSTRSEPGGWDMDMFVVEGGRPLCGRVRVGGAKNAALPIMAATLLADGPSLLSHVPDLEDVRTLLKVLERLRLSGERLADGRLCLEATEQGSSLAPYDLVRRMRASVCVLGPLLAKRGAACVSLPGGCAIGYRPIDLHLRGLAALGADLRIEQGYIVATADRLRGARVDLRGPQGSTVTGTANVLMAACLARGTTVIESAAREPEIVDLASFLVRMGAQIAGAGTSTLIIDGVDHLTGANHTVIPDRIEAATLLCAAAITRGSATVEGVNASHLTAVLELLTATGAGITVSGDVVSIDASAPLRAINCNAVPYPGFPTDTQAQLTALLTQAEGTSRLTDTVFPDRFLHLPELARLGARVDRQGATAVVRGPSPLTGAAVMASDLRASAALVLAALAASGTSEIRRIYHLDRGYERLESKLADLGAQVHRVRDGDQQRRFAA